MQPEMSEADYKRKIAELEDEMRDLNKKLYIHDKYLNIIAKIIDNCRFHE